MGLNRFKKFNSTRCCCCSETFIRKDTCHTRFMPLIDMKKIRGECNASFQGQVVQVLRDVSEKIPQWYLYRIADGTGEIALFTEREQDLEVGEHVRVTDAWTKKNEKGLSANLDNGSAIEKLSQVPQILKDRLAPIPILSLEGTNAGQRVQITLRLVEKYPPQINRVESQKMVAADITRKYNTVVLFGEEMELAEKLKEEELFVLIGVVGSYNDTLLLNLGPDGKIIRGKKALKTPAGKIYLSNLMKTNEEVRRIFFERKDLSHELASACCAGFSASVLPELVPRLATFVHNRIYKGKKYADEYYSILSQVEMEDEIGIVIPNDYIEYLKENIKKIGDEVMEHVDLEASPKEFVSYLIDTLYVLTIDLQSYNETQIF
jgi:hypothetical protein